MQCDCLPTPLLPYKLRSQGKTESEKEGMRGGGNYDPHTARPKGTQTVW